MTVPYPSRCFGQFDRRAVNVRLSTFRRRMRQYFVAALAMAVPASAWATPVGIGSGTVSGMDIVRVFGGLIVVLAVLLGGLWLLKRFGARGLSAQSRSLRVISSLPVGNRARLLLVQVQEAQLLIGVTVQRVELVARFDAVSADADAVSPRTEGSFIERLRQSLNRERDDKDEGCNRLANSDRGGDSPRD